MQSLSVQCVKGDGCANKGGEISQMLDRRQVIHCLRHICSTVTSCFVSADVVL